MPKKLQKRRRRILPSTKSDLKASPKVSQHKLCILDHFRKKDQISREFIIKSQKLAESYRANTMKYIYPTLAKLLVADFISRAGEGPNKATVNGLTPREQEVLGVLAEGLSNDDIAERLAISRHTVARHRENLMRKLNLHSRSELVKYAIRKGLINP